MCSRLDFIALWFLIWCESSGNTAFFQSSIMLVTQIYWKYILKDQKEEFIWKFVEAKLSVRLWEIKALHLTSVSWELYCVNSSEYFGNILNMKTVEVLESLFCSCQCHCSLFSSTCSLPLNVCTCLFAKFWKKTKNKRCNKRSNFTSLEFAKDTPKLSYWNSKLNKNYFPPHCRYIKDLAVWQIQLKIFAIKSICTCVSVRIKKIALIWMTFVSSASHSRLLCVCLWQLCVCNKIPLR